ncbi:hypothetical protein VTL71DRAFT_6036 [Oculimacula yallundae]|uniref:Uncharacterized protein n=1 Tax=Oculimacula yallundae TaxID=86028 RepID=A0ABR4BZ78_9HELO
MLVSVDSSTKVGRVKDVDEPLASYLYLIITPAIFSISSNIIQIYLTLLTRPAPVFKIRFKMHFNCLLVIAFMVAFVQCGTAGPLLGRK